MVGPATGLAQGKLSETAVSSTVNFAVKKQTGKTFYIMDEPTTGLHHEDINLLLDVIRKLILFGNTVLIIEHNLDVILQADHIIDLGPEGGIKGGEIIFEGSVQELMKNKKSYTGKFIALEYNN